jgi:hypothetical protein
VSRQPLPVRLLVDRRRRTGEVIWPPGIPDETIFPGHEIGLKRIPATTFSFEATEGDHAVNHPQRNLPRVPEQCRPWHGHFEGKAVMAEVVIALLVLVSAGIFSAHAYDAFHAKPAARNMLKRART